MDWLDRYATRLHDWRSAEHQGRRLYYRPLGIIETAFDSDARYYEGRSEIHLELAFNCKTKESPTELRQRILLVLTCLRLHHTMLLTRYTNFDPTYMDAAAKTTWNSYFVIQKPANEKDALHSTACMTNFLEDHYATVDKDEFRHHILNTSRIIKPDESLTRFFVLPVTQVDPDTKLVRFAFSFAHDIADGIAGNNWLVHTLELLNTPAVQLQESLGPLIRSISDRLIPPQEGLYPPISGNKARQRWFWAITLVLRSVRKPGPQHTPNPLYRTTPLPPSLPADHTFSAVLPYLRPPDLNTSLLRGAVSPARAARLFALCRATHCSIGAGLFVLTALTTMSFFPHPGPFTGSFPLNPRAMFPTPCAADSCMLAFSRGVVLPWLDPSLPLAPRIRLLLRSAQRQLSLYQKRPRGGAAKVLHRFSPAASVLQTNYLDSLTRVAEFVPTPDPNTFLTGSAAVHARATCGVSSVGALDPRLFKEYEYANYAGHLPGVRAREGEFLVGIAGAIDGGIGVSVSYDACAVDEEMADKWRDRLVTMLDELDEAAKL